MTLFLCFTLYLAVSHQSSLWPYQGQAIPYMEGSCKKTRCQTSNKLLSSMLLWRCFQTAGPSLLPISVNKMQTRKSGGSSHQKSPIPKTHHFRCGAMPWLPLTASCGSLAGFCEGVGGTSTSCSIARSVWTLVRELDVHAIRGGIHHQRACFRPRVCAQRGKQI